MTTCENSAAISASLPKYNLWSTSPSYVSVTPLSSTSGNFLSTFLDPRYPTSREGLNLQPYTGGVGQRFTYDATLRDSTGTLCFTRVGSTSVPVLDSGHCSNLSHYDHIESNPKDDTNMFGSSEWGGTTFAVVASDDTTVSTIVEGPTDPPWTWSPCEATWITDTDAVACCSAPLSTPSFGRDGNNGFTTCGNYDGTASNQVACPPFMTNYCNLNGWQNQECTNFIESGSSTTSASYQTVQDVVAAYTAKNPFSVSDPFYTTIIPYICSAQKGACDDSLTTFCSGYTRSDLQNETTGTLWKICGCHLPQSQYLLGNTDVPNSCDPICSTGGTVQNNQWKPCTESVCVMNDITVDIINSQQKGNITIGNICQGQGCSSGGGCTCWFSGVDVNEIDSSIGGSTIIQNGCSQCWTLDSDGNSVNVPCSPSSPPQQKCTSDLQCQTPQVCSSQGICVTPCSSSNDCTPGDVCVNGQCSTPTPVEQTFLERISSWLAGHEKLSIGMLIFFVILFVILLAIIVVKVGRSSNS